MSNKNIQMKFKNQQGGWDDLFPKTKAAITELDNGKSVEQTIAELLSIINSKVSNTDLENRIKNLIGSAPAALDTLQEIAKALNNDANFAATITNTLAQKVDKVTGKQLTTEDFTTTLKNKLDSIKINADGTVQITPYVHPATHPANIITQDASNRFVSDLEKKEWSGKAKISVGKLEDNTADFWFQEL